MSYFTGNRLRDLFMLLQISLEWGRLYPENLDIVDNSKQEDDDLPDTDGVPDAQGWITWKGGECPIPDAKAGEYEIRFRNGKTDGEYISAHHWQWEHSSRAGDYNIEAYRIVKPDNSQFSNSEQNDARINGIEATHIYFDEAKDIDETVFNSLTGVIRYPGKVRVYKVVKDAIDKVEKELKLLKKPDWSTAPEWANYWAVDSSGCAYWYKGKPTCLNYTWLPSETKYGFEKMLQDTKWDKSHTNWKDSLEKRPVSEHKDYPVMEGFHKHDCNNWIHIPFGIRIRVQRMDKSFSEGNSAGFNWNENGMDTIIGWKPV